MGGGRVLAGDEDAVDDDLFAPGLGGELVLAAVLLEAVLEQKVHLGGEASLVLLGVGEAGDGLASDEVGAIVELGIDDGGGAVADGGDGLVLGGELGDQGVRGCVEGEVVHGAVAARVKLGSNVSFIVYIIREDCIEGRHTMASNSEARPTKLESFSVFSQMALWFSRKFLEEGSLANISTEAWSRGATPPLGEAKVISTPASLRTSKGWASSGWETISSPGLGVGTRGGLRSTYQVPADGLARLLSLVDGGEDDENLGSHCV